MDHLHKRIHLSPQEAVEVELNQAANVMLLTPSNYRKYKRGQGGYEYYGGQARQSPYEIYPPRGGEYELVIDLGGNQGRIKYSCRIVSC